MIKVSAVRPSLVAAFVGFVAIVVYANSLLNGFALDDVFIIQWNSRVHEVGNLREIWLTPYWPSSGRELGLYRPAAIFLYSVQWAVGGGEPWLFHVVSMLLHAIASVLVFALLRTFVGNAAAFAGAVLFAVHPVHTEAVANVVGQAELITAVALLGACLIHATRPLPPEVSWPRRVSLVLLFLVAMLTKENAVILPLLLILVDVAQGRVRLGKPEVRRYASAMSMLLLLMCAALAAYMIVRFDVMSGALIGVDANPAIPYLRDDVRVLNALRAFPEFMRLLFFPHELAADYLPAVIMPVEEVRPMVVLGAILLAALAGMAMATFWVPRVGLPAAWFLVTIATVSNLFFPIGVLVAERTLYLPSFALAAGVAFAWSGIAPEASRNRLFVMSGALFLATTLLGVRTWIRNPDWKDNPAVYRALVRDHPHAYRAQWVQAAGLRLQGEAELARQHYEMAYRIYPRDAQMLAEYGYFLLDAQDIDRAIAVLEASYSLQPRTPSTVATLARAYLLANRPDDALRYVRLAERLGASESTMVVRSQAHYSLGDYDLAVGAARIVLRKSDVPWQTAVFLARTLAVGGYPDEAFRAIARARDETSSSARRAILDDVDAAIRAGCYAGGAPRGTGAARLICDPLAEIPVADATQNANALQNASDNAAPGVSLGTR